MSPSERFKHLLDEQDVDGALELLRSFTQQERRSIARDVKKWQRQYNEYIQEGNTWRNKITTEESHILTYGAFICFTKQEIEKNFPTWIISKEHLDKILPWYHPSWFGDVINGFASEAYLPYCLNYEYAIELTKKGFLQPHPQLLARILVPVIYELKEKQYHYVPEKLDVYPETLDQHVWYLFQYETNIHASDWYIGINKSPDGDQNWHTAFAKYAAEGKLERVRLLKEAIYASNKNFNKTLSGWFADLFIKLEPLGSELLSLQQDIFSLFSSPHSKVVNTALQSCKAIVTEPEFDRQTFLDHVPLLLSSSTKSVITSTMQLLEKIEKTDKVPGQELARITAQALFHKDESLQMRAAKLILRSGSPDDRELAEQLQMYAPSLFAGVKTALAGFIGSSPTEYNEPTDVRQTALLQEIETVPGVDGLIFFASQSFDNNQPYHFDMLPALLLSVQKQITGEDINRLEPAFQRALKTYFGDIRSTQGNLDHMLAAFFLDYGQLLMKKFPKHKASLWKLYNGFLVKSQPNKELWEQHGNNLNFLSGWETYGETKLFEPHKLILSHCLSMLAKETSLPLLSTPTHAPCWIDPMVLVQRFLTYQDAEAEASDMDLQVALSRCNLSDPQAAIAIAEKDLNGELKNLVRFLMIQDEKPHGPFTQPSAWMIAGLTKAPGKLYKEFQSFSYSKEPFCKYSGQYPWDTISERYSYDSHKWENEKFVTIPVFSNRKVLKLDLNPVESAPKKSGLGKLISKFTGGNERSEFAMPLIFDHFRIMKSYIGMEDRDIERLMSLTPNHPEPLLAMVTEKCLKEPTFFSESEKRTVIATLRSLHSLWKLMGETGHLFIATCMISSEKTAAAYAAEIWQEAVRNKTIDSELIGRILGIHERIEFAPLKRFTDLVLSNLMGVSKEHNRELEEMISAMLAELPTTPVKNLKKLLEIYLELLSINGSSVKNERARTNIEAWKETEGLSKMLMKVPEMIKPLAP